MNIKIVKQPSLLEQFAFSKSTLFTQIKKGLMPSSISLGERAVGYLQHELDAVLSAHIAGKSNSQIKELVKSLTAKRKGVYMNNCNRPTQVQIVCEHVKEHGSINTDEARELYRIADVPKCMETVGKLIPIRHIPINRPHPITGKIRGIMEYRLGKDAE